MTAIDPARFTSDAALMRIWDALPEARVVGGAVRDALAGKPVADLDLATPRPPKAVITALTKAGIKAVPTGLAHGTITAVADGRGFEVTTLRRDMQTDGRHAVVAFTDDWQQDASRRDFTINAMSADRLGTVFDYFGGALDLAAGWVRFVGKAETRIKEDYLRILRFFRFFARYGRRDPDPETAQALRDGVPGLAILSAERVWHELRLILSVQDPWPAIALMRRLGVWAAVLPDAPGAARPDLPPDAVLRLAALLAGNPVALAARLKLSNEDRDRLVRLLATPAPEPAMDDADLRRLLADHDGKDLLDRSRLDARPGAEVVRTRLQGMPKPRFCLVGRDVLRLGVPPGPRVGVLLRDVRQWWLERGCVDDRSRCEMELAKRACAG